MGTAGVPVDIGGICVAIKIKQGNVAQASKYVGIDEATFYRNLQLYPELQEALEQARELRRLERLEKDQRLVEEAYRSIGELLESNDTVATLFTLKCKAGWIQNPVDQQVNIQINNQPYAKAD